MYIFTTLLLLGLDLQPEIQTLKVCTLIYDICVWHTLVKNKQMMYVIYDIGCQSLHGCEWRCRCFLSLFRQLCKCSFFVLCYMWPANPLGLFSAPAWKVTFFSLEFILLLNECSLSSSNRSGSSVLEKSNVFKKIAEECLLVEN